jgi:predicted CXXCH cytochrome family protein
VHQVQEIADSFSGRCLTCHTMHACGKFKTLGASIRTECVDCHMPLVDSAKITLAEGKNTLREQLRSHRIAIYGDAAELVERGLRRK